MRLVLILVTVTVLGLFAPSAFAQGAVQPPPPDIDSAARAVFEDGRRAFESGDYETALARFQQAYDLSHRPLLYLNVATTLDRLRRDEEALAAFERYLEIDPSAANRAEVEGRIRVLRRALEQRQPAAPPDETTDAAPPPQAHVEESDGLPPLVFICGASVTAVFLGITIWSGLDTSSLNDDYLATTNATDAKSALDDADSAQTRTNVLLGVTLVGAAATGVLAALTDWDGPSSSGERQVALTPSIGVSPNGAYASVSGAF